MLVKLLALFYITFIVLIVQYPDIFSNFFNQPIGKFIILLILLLLTLFNIFAGLICTVIVILFYLLMHTKGYVYENFISPLPPIDEISEIKNDNTTIDKLNVERNLKSKNSNSLPILKISNDNPLPYDKI
jgi:energy-coupling factor transporter transmembrane protein EcfT